MSTTVRRSRETVRLISGGLLPDPSMVGRTELEQIKGRREEGRLTAELLPGHSEITGRTV